MLISLAITFVFVFFNIINIRDNIIFRRDSKNNKKFVLFNNLYNFFIMPFKLNHISSRILWGFYGDIMCRINMLTLNWVFIFLVIYLTRCILKMN